MRGLLLIDKPEGITSFGAVARIKRLAGVKRVGHTGTLDPMATGVLPVLIGRPTVLCDCLLEADKEYIAQIQLGVTTDTLDRTGTVLKTSPVSVSKERLQEVLQGFLGKSMQLPPMYSALKKDGVRLYELARNGQEVERRPREIEIKELELLHFENGLFSVRVACSKGTYIRSLAADIGERLATGAVLTGLRRTKTAGFSVGDCIPLEQITADNISSLLLNEERAVLGYPAVTVSAKQAARFSNGGDLALERLHLPEAGKEGSIFRVKCNGLFYGLGAIDLPSGSLRVKCLVRHASDAD